MGIESLFSSVLTLETKTVVDDAAGGSADTWATKTAGVKCRKRTVPAQYRTTNAQGEFVYDTTFRVGATVAADERTDRVVCDGVTYEIASVVEARGRETVDHKILQCREVR